VREDAETRGGVGAVDEMEEGPAVRGASVEVDVGIVVPTS
jgi:hypothetical protein